MSGFWQTDSIAKGYTPAETAEARIDPDQENDNDRDGDWR